MNPWDLLGNVALWGLVSVLAVIVIVVCAAIVVGAVRGMLNWFRR